MPRIGPAVALSGLLTLVACATSRAPASPALPFHVAVLPITVHESLALPAGDEGDGGDRMGIALDGDSLRDALVRALEQGCFARVSTLDLPTADDVERIPPGVSADPATWDDRTRNRWWIQEAARVRADILGVVALTYDPAVEGSVNAWVWPNLGLFLLGGPFCYFVDDRTYEVRASLQVRFYDVGLMSQGMAQLLDRSAEVGDYEVEYAGTTLDFIDRAGRNAGSWALSLLLPVALLAKQTEHVQAHIEEDAAGDLSESLGRKILTDQAELLTPPGLNFTLLPEDVRARPTADGYVQLEGQLRFRRDSRVEDLGACRLVAGSATSTFTLGTPRLVEDGRFENLYVYDVNGRVELPPGVRTVQLTVTHGGGDDRFRTYTFALEREGGASAPDLEAGP